MFVSSLYSLQEEERKKIDKYFNMTLQEMMEVEIVTASRSPEKVSDIPASVVLITREDIETYGYRTLAEILENIPGLFAIEDYEQEKNFGVRGFWSGVTNDNMIILVNGVTQVDDFQSNYPITKIPVPVEAIDRIEVVRGPMSVIYGNGSFYGVINIITNEISKDSKNLISLSMGSQDTEKFFIRGSGQKDDFKYVFNASISDTYGIDQPFNEMVDDPLELANFLVPLDHRTGGRLENNKKYFNFFGSFKHFFLDLNYSQSEIETIFLMPPPTEGTQNNFFTTTVCLGYNKKFSDSFSIDGKFIFSKNRVFQDYDFLFEDFYGIQQIDSSASEIGINLFYTPSNSLEVKTGIHYRSVFNVSSMFDLPSFGSPSLENNYTYLDDKDNITTQAIFTQVSYAPVNKFNIVAGVRLEQMPKYDLVGITAGGLPEFNKQTGTYNQDKIEVIPRFAAIYKLTNNNIFKLLYGMAINRPSFFQNSKNSLDPLRDDLKPEKIETFELNYIAAFTSKLTLSTSVFRNVLENLITRVVRFDEFGNYQSWSANAGRMVTKGIEITLNSEPFKNFRLELSGTYQETDDKRPGYENIETAYSPGFLGYLKAAYRTKRFTFSLTGNFVDDIETYWDEALVDENNPFGQRIGQRVEGYFLLRANVRIDDLFLKGLYLNIRFSNVLDEEIRYPTTNYNTWANRGTLGLGRTFLVSIGWNF